MDHNARHSTAIVRGRKFIVHRHKDTDKVLRVCERKLHGEGKPWEAWYQQSIWHHDNHPFPKRGIVLEAIKATS